MDDKNYDDPVMSALDFMQLETVAELSSKMNEVAIERLNMSFRDIYETDLGCYNGQDSFGHLVTMILYVIVGIVGVCGNTLVIYVVLRFSKMQTITNTYILNLAIADECFLIGIPFLLYTMQTGSWKFGDYACKAYMVSTSITQFTSSIFLLIMAADRYVAVCHPISSQRYRTPILSKVVSIVAWLISVLLMLPVILFANTIKNGEYISCNIKWPEGYNTQSGNTFILYTLALGFATPLSFILCFYYLLIHKLSGVERKHKSKDKKRSHRKVTKLVLTVITVYILCWLPYWISQLTIINSSPSSSSCISRLEITIFLLVSCLAYSNSAINPFLYAFLSENFKKSFKKAFNCSPQNYTDDTQMHVKHHIFSKWDSKGRKKAKAINKHRTSMAGDNTTMNLLTTSTTYGTGITATTLSAADTPSETSPSKTVGNSNKEYTQQIDNSCAITSDGSDASDDSRPPIQNTDL